MQICNLDRDAEPCTTADGSTIRELMNVIHPPARNQSLAEASLPAGTATERHYHQAAEEIYFILEGHGRMEIDGEECAAGPGDAGFRDGVRPYREIPPNPRPNSNWLKIS